MSNEENRNLCNRGPFARDREKWLDLTKVPRQRRHMMNKRNKRINEISNVSCWTAFYLRIALWDAHAWALLGSEELVFCCSGRLRAITMKVDDVSNTCSIF